MNCLIKNSECILKKNKCKDFYKDNFYSRIALHCIALHCIALHCIALHCIVLHCIALNCIALHCIALHCIALHCIALHCIVLHCIALHCIAMHCIALQSVHFTTLQVDRPQDTAHWSSVMLTLVHLLRRWTDINSALAKRAVLTGRGSSRNSRPKPEESQDREKCSSILWTRVAARRGADHLVCWFWLGQQWSSLIRVLLGWGSVCTGDRHVGRLGRQIREQSADELNQE